MGMFVMDREPRLRKVRTQDGKECVTLSALFSWVCSGLGSDGQD